MKKVTAEAEEALVAVSEQDETFYGNRSNQCERTLPHRYLVFTAGRIGRLGIFRGPRPAIGVYDLSCRAGIAGQIETMNRPPSRLAGELRQSCNKRVHPGESGQSSDRWSK